MILCLGTTPVLQRSMVFERVTPEGVNRATAVYDYASGKSPNVARVLHTLGEPVVAAGFVGGARGGAFLRDLEAAGIPHRFVNVAAQTRQCVTVIDRAARTATELVEESTPVAPGDWERLYEVVDALVPDATGLVLSGSLPPGAPQDFYLSCLRRTNGRAIPAVLDTRGEPLRLALGHDNFVAKLNREELAATVGRELSTEDDVLAASRKAVPPGGAMVITLGASGAIAAGATGGWRIRVPSVETRSAVGSGDAFSAGLIAGLARRQPIADACAWGAACGAANAMTDLAGHLTREDVERIRPQVRVEPV